MTALFADIVGSTALGERLPPDELKILVGECASLLTAIAEKHGGRVTAYMGDGIAAFFGIDGVQEDDSQRAVLAGLEMAELIRTLALGVEKEWSIDGLAVRIGINRGRAGIGLVGDSEPQRIAFGDAINVAARLESAAPPNAVLIGRSVVQHIRGFELQDLGPLSIRGRAEPVGVMRVLAEDKDAQSSASVNLVGRAAEREALNRVGKELRRGRGGILFVTGEAGIGKTVLLHAFAADQGNGVEWLQGSCSHSGRLGPYLPFVEMLWDWIELRPIAPPVLVRTKLNARLQAGMGQDGAERVFPYLARLLDASHAQDGLAQLPREAVAEGIRIGIRTWLEAVATRRPLVVAIDDMERADEATCKVITDLFALADEVPVLTACVLRPELQTAAWGLRGRAFMEFAHRLLEVSLYPLSPDEAVSLLATLDPDGELPGEVRAFVADRAEGNPLFLEELLRTARMSGSWRNVIPPRLEDVLVARIDALGEEGRRIVQTAAVIGRRFRRSTLQHAIGSEDLNEGLSELLRLEVFEERHQYPDTEFEFRHGLLREAALSTLPARRRQELHLRVAEALVPHAEGDSKVWEEIAYHYVEGRDNANAVPALVKAADWALSLAAVSEAIDLLRVSFNWASESRDEQAIDVGGRLARVLGETERLPEAVELYRVLLDTEELQPRQSANMQMDLAEVLARALRVTEADHCLQAAAQAVDHMSDDERARLACLRALTSMRAQDFRGARRYLDSLDGLVTRSRMSAESEFARAWLEAGYWASQGDFEACERWWRHRWRVVGAGATRFGDLEKSKEEGILHLLNGRLERAAGALWDCYSAAKETGHTRLAGEAGMNLLYVLSLAGDLYRGRQLGEELVQTIGDASWRANLMCNLGALHFESGDLLGARRFLADARRHAERNGDGLTRQGAALRCAMCDALEGRLAPKTISERLEASLREFEAVDGRFEHRALALQWLGAVALREGDIEAAIDYSERAVREARRSERFAILGPLRVLGSAREQQAPGTGTATLSEGLALAREMGAKVEEGRLLVALASAGRDPLHNLRQAQDLFETCGALGDLSDADRRIEELGWAAARDAEAAPRSAASRRSRAILDA